MSRCKQGFLQAADHCFLSCTRRASEMSHKKSKRSTSISIADVDQAHTSSDRADLLERSAESGWTMKLACYDEGMGKSGASPALSDVGTDTAFASRHLATPPKRRKTYVLRPSLERGHRVCTEDKAATYADDRSADPSRKPFPLPLADTLPAISQASTQGRCTHRLCLGRTTNMMG